MSEILKFGSQRQENSEKKQLEVSEVWFYFLKSVRVFIIRETLNKAETETSNTGFVPG